MKGRRDISGTDMRMRLEVSFGGEGLFGNSENGLFWEIRMGGEKWQNEEHGLKSGQMWKEGTEVLEENEQEIKDI